MRRNAGGFDATHCVIYVGIDHQRREKTPDILFCGSEDECWTFIHKHQGQSVHWALEHGGYSIQPMPFANPARRPRQYRPGWNMVSYSPVIYQHAGSGWQVHHCGHGTAIFPYHALSPSTPGLIVSQSGRGWQKLDWAMKDVEALLAGRAELVTNRIDHPQYGIVKSIIGLEGDLRQNPPYFHAGPEHIRRFKKSRLHDSRRAFYFFDKPEFDYGHLYGNAITVVDLDLKRTFDYRRPDHLQMLLTVLRTDPKWESWWVNEARDGDWGILENKYFIRWLLNNGFDSYLVNDHPEIAVGVLHAKSIIPRDEYYWFDRSWKRWEDRMQRVPFGQKPVGVL